MRMCLNEWIVVFQLFRHSKYNLKNKLHCKAVYLKGPGIDFIKDILIVLTQVSVTCK